MGIERIRCQTLRDRVITADQAALLVHDGMTVGISGFTSVGYPKAVPLALAARAQGGDTVGITLIAGGNVGDEVDGALARTHVLRRRYGFQNNADLRAQINDDTVKYVDMHVSHVAHYLKSGYFGPIDLAILEVTAVSEDGGLVPTCAYGIFDLLAQQAKEIILEVNSLLPEALEGMHDVYLPGRPPQALPIPLTGPADRIGGVSVHCDCSKIKAIVLTELEDGNQDLMAPTPEMTAIAEHLVRFFQAEMAAGRLATPLPPLQSGVGGVANAVLSALSHAPLQDLSIYTEVMQDAVLDLIDAGKVFHASGTALTISPSRRSAFYQDLGRYRTHIVLRPQELSNSPEVIRRLGVIAMNTAIELDLAGNVNSTHIGGTRIMNGIGGSGDYTRNAGLSIFTTASTAKNGSLSCIVPHVSHVDHTEHDTQIIVTEQGLADLRGLTAYERAEALISQCAHPRFRDELRAYRDRSYAKNGGRHGICRL